MKLTLYTTRGGYKYPHKCEITPSEARIEFTQAPFAMKDEIKSMKGSRWHGFETPPRKVWTVENCQRNWFQLRYLMGEDVYARYDQGVVPYASKRDLMAHQKHLVASALTYNYVLWAAAMGVGKTLAGIELMDHVDGEWWWVGPKNTLPAIKREFEKWGFDKHVKLFSYERMVSHVDDVRHTEDWAPVGIIFDEASRLKNPSSKRSIRAQILADQIRAVHGTQGYVVLMSGTPSPKAPVDWWSLCEIAWPGFLKEGSVDALKYRLGFFEDRETGAGVFPTLIGWKDDENKCGLCGTLKKHHKDKDHPWKASINEVGLMYERLKGLVQIVHKKDCLDLPDKIYETVRCKPSPNMERAAAAIVSSAPTAIQAVTLLRELSDGFLYKDVKGGTKKCTTCKEGKINEWFDPDDPDQGFDQVDFFEPEYVAKLQTREVDCPQCKGTTKAPKYVRKIEEVPCPKDQVVIDKLQQCESVGRMIIFASFQGTIDRMRKLCTREGWDVVSVDGRGWVVLNSDHKHLPGDPLDYWSNLEDNEKVAFVAHPASGGLGLNLSEAPMIVYVSNDHNPESRSQSEDRAHRKGMDENRGLKIVDIFHLPTDERIHKIITSNRKLEKMTLGDLAEDYKDLKESK